MADYTTEPTTKKITDDVIERIKKRSLQIEQEHSEKLKMFERYREIYFMTNIEKPKNAGVDERDWKLTASPSGRNEVTGMKRLMDTGEISITIKRGDETDPSSAQIEKGLKRILATSGEMKRARVEKDANLAAVLWGPVSLRVEALDDLIAVQKKPAYKKRLERMRERSPFIISVLNAEESFPDWGRFGMLAHVEKYRVRGAELKETWGNMNCEDDREYIVHDYLDLENRVVWADGVHEVLYAGPHGLPDMNVIVRYAGGSSLFYKPEEQLQSFLYAKAKGDWDKRENLVWTYIFTSIYMQGLPGKTVMVQNPETTQPTVDIDYASGIKKIVVTGARADMVDLNVIDSDIIQIKNMMDEVSGDSTIRGQTLGENISGATFSAMAMLSSAGKLPMIDPTEAVQEAFKDAFMHILDRIKMEGIENELIPPAIIPEKYEVSVMIKPKLPQDDLRNAQVASALGDKVSTEWVHENLLQITDTEAMQKQIYKDVIKNAILQGMISKPEVMEQFIQGALGMSGMQSPPPPPQQPPPGPQGPGPMPQPPGPQGMGQEPTPEELAMMQQGGGMESMPQTDQMIPPQERM